MKRTIYTDGWKNPWKDLPNTMFLVENGELVHGIFDGKTIYPYKWNSKLKCYVNVSGITARYGIFKKVRWFE